LFRFGFLFLFALLFALFGIVVVLPGIESTARRTLIIGVLVAIDFGALFVLGSAVLGKFMVTPMELLADDARRIAGGDYHHRIGTSDSLELRQVQSSVNDMADRLIADQELLAENVESLAQTNRDLIKARDQIIHTPRLASVGTLRRNLLLSNISPDRIEIFRLQDEEFLTSVPVGSEPWGPHAEHLRAPQSGRRVWRHPDRGELRRNQPLDGIPRTR